jgi:hypothetical protein
MTTKEAFKAKENRTKVIGIMIGLIFIIGLSASIIFGATKAPQKMKIHYSEKNLKLVEYPSDDPNVKMGSYVPVGEPEITPLKDGEETSNSAQEAVDEFLKNKK